MRATLETLAQAAVFAVLRAPSPASALGAAEVMVAAALGADVVKIFPASLGGPAYLAALRAPLPHVPMMPTGGVDAANLGAWLAAGAVAVGALAEHRLSVAGGA